MSAIFSRFSLISQKFSVLLSLESSLFKFLSFFSYSTSEEITNTSGTAYTAGGATLTNAGVSLSSTTAFTDFSDVTYTSASFTANGAMIYNTTTDGGSGTTNAVAIIAFGGDKTASNGTFKIEFPAAAATTAIIRLA